MRKKVILIILIMVVLVSGGIGAAAYGWHAWAGKTGNIGWPGDGAAGQDAGVGRVNVLLVGADERQQDAKFNTDSLILASIDPDSKLIAMLSIPRDTRILLPKYGYVKINSVLALTDYPTLLAQVSNLTGLTVNSYIETNFSGFKSVIDTLGGITVDVEKDMYHDTEEGGADGVINLHKGVQRLNGIKALQYARFRSDALGDISRTARQQAVLKAVAKEMLQPGTIPKLPVLIPQLMKAVHTNLSLGNLLKLARVAAGFDSAGVITQTLPGGFLDLDGVSYWDVDEEEAKTVTRNLLKGVTTDKVIDHQLGLDLQQPIQPASPHPNNPVPKLPGNSQDPNGQGSTGFQDVLQKGWPAGPDGAA